MAQNEMRAKRGLPVEVRSMEGLGVTAARPRLEFPSLLSGGFSVIFVPQADYVAFSVLLLDFRPGFFQVVGNNTDLLAR